MPWKNTETPWKNVIINFIFLKITKKTVTHQDRLFYIFEKNHQCLKF